MDITHDPNAEAEYFTQRAKDWFSNNKVPEFTNTDEAIGMISAADRLVAIYIKQLEDAHSTYTSELITEFGSALGEAFKMLFLGEWKFSNTQNRWVVTFVSPAGSTYDINIFHKLEKRFENGMEDSIQYLFDGLKSMYLQQAKDAGYKG